MASDHQRRTRKLLLETFCVSVLLALLASWTLTHGYVLGALLLAVPRGLWIQRHYCVGHEAAHGKLYPGAPLKNAVWGQLALIALLTPLPVFRKIHQFHHGHNRRDLHTSALDVIWIAKDTPARRFGAWCQWLFAVFGSGWFWHGLVSVLLFLCLPLRWARQISPAFAGWTTRERTLSIAFFVFAVGLHVVVWMSLGAVAGWVLVGAPLVVFSWTYSAQLYIYHYRTGVGPKVTEHARAVGGPLANWWLLNLNEHNTHHARPALVWYALPAAATVTTEPRPSFTRGVLQQLHGPRIEVRPSGAPSPTTAHPVTSPVTDTTQEAR
jgi:fatty acid desaturase